MTTFKVIKSQFKWSKRLKFYNIQNVWTNKIEIYNTYTYKYDYN